MQAYNDIIDHPGQGEGPRQENIFSEVLKNAASVILSNRSSLTPWAQGDFVVINATVGSNQEFVNVRSLCLWSLGSNLRMLADSRD